MPWFGLVAGAGRGRRFRGSKQLAPLLGRPVLYYSLAAFQRCPGVSQVVVVAPQTRLDDVLGLCRRHRLTKVVAIVPGGRERTDSVRLGLAALPDSGLVAVHDAARPLVTPEMLESGFRACVRYRAVTFGMEATDTLKRVEADRIRQTVSRAGIILVQTPQFFDIALLRAAHDRTRSAATDDCALVERLGLEVFWIPTPGPNPKMTTRADLALCAALLKARCP